LPALPLTSRHTEEEALRATGTEGAGARTLAPPLALTSDNSGKPQSIPGKTAATGSESAKQSTIVGSADFVKVNERLASAVIGLQEVGATGFEPATSRSRRRVSGHAKMLRSVFWQWLCANLTLSQTVANHNKF
jgi:hypothetical protein